MNVGRESDPSIAIDRSVSEVPMSEANYGQQYDDDPYSPGRSRGAKQSEFGFYKQHSEVSDMLRVDSIYQRTNTNALENVLGDDELMQSGIESIVDERIEQRSR